MSFEEWYLTSLTCISCLSLSGSDREESSGPGANLHPPNPPQPDQRREPRPQQHAKSFPEAQAQTLPPPSPHQHLRVRREPADSSTHGQRGGRMHRGGEQRRRAGERHWAHQTRGTAGQPSERQNFESAAARVAEVVPAVLPREITCRASALSINRRLWFLSQTTSDPEFHSCFFLIM